MVTRALVLLSLLCGCSSPKGAHYVLQVTPTGAARLDASKLVVTLVRRAGEIVPYSLDLPHPTPQGDFWVIDIESRGWGDGLESVDVIARAGDVDLARGSGTPRGETIEVVLADVDPNAPDLAGVDLAGVDLAGLDLATPDLAMPGPDLAGTDLAMREDLGPGCMVLDEDAEADSRLNSISPNGTAGDAEVLYLGHDWVSGIFRFDIAKLPAGAQIVQAQLSLAYPSRGCNLSCTGDCTSEDHDLTYVLYFVSSGWDEATVTYNEKSPGVDWLVPGAGGADRSKSIATLGHLAHNTTTMDFATSDLSKWRQSDKLSFLLVPSGGVWTVVAAKDSGAMCTAYPKPHLQITYCP